MKFSTLYLDWINCTKLNKLARLGAEVKARSVEFCIELQFFRLIPDGAYNSIRWGNRSEC